MRSLFLLAGVAILFGISVAAYQSRREPHPPTFLQPERAPTTIEACVAAPIEYAQTSDERNDVVFFGESSCRSGIDPLKFQSLTGLSAFNLGSVGLLGPDAQVLLAASYLTKHPAPKVAVICLLPFSLEFETDNDVTARFVKAYRLDRMNSPAGIPQLFFMGIPVRETFSQPLDARDMPLDGLPSETFRTFQLQLRKSRGMWPFAGEHGPLSKLPCSAKVAVRPDWSQAVGKIANMYAHRDCRVIVRFMPLSSAVKGQADFSAVERWTDGLRKDGVSVTPVSVWYDPADMWDNIHLNSAGVSKFMPVVAKDVEQAIGK